jgi:hypothetical protein
MVWDRCCKGSQLSGMLGRVSKYRQDSNVCFTNKHRNGQPHPMTGLLCNWTVQDRAFRFQRSYERMNNRFEERRTETYRRAPSLGLLRAGDNS